MVDIHGYLSSSPDQQVVVEYDGEYYHQRPDYILRDLDKTRALLNAGVLVVRIRERNLVHLGIEHQNLLQLRHDYVFNGDISATVTLIENWLLTR